MFKNNYHTKPGYQIRLKNAPYVDEQPTGTVYQPHVYELAIFLARRGGFRYIIDIGAGNGEKLQPVASEFNIIAIDYAPNIKALRGNLPNAEVIDYNLEKGLPRISADILKDSVVVSSDVIEHIAKPHKYLKALARMARTAPYVLVSTPDRTRARGPEHMGPPNNPFHVREWTIDELHILFEKYGINTRIGHTVSNDWGNFKATSLAIFGTEAIPSKIYKKQNSLLSIVTAYNESDIIEQTVRHLISQGSDVHIIENWSTDKTYTVIKKLGSQFQNVTFERFPAKKPVKHTYEWEKLLKRVEEVASNATQEWVMHNDADEHRLSPWKGVNLVQALAYVSELGYNAVDFTVADFRPTKDGYDGSVAPDEFFNGFQFVGISGYLLQIKCWKSKYHAVIHGTGGHSAEFEGRKVYPMKFITKHYPLRSSEHAKRKIFKDRKERFSKAERAKGWHIQYDKYKVNDRFLWDEKDVNKYTPDYFYTEYIVELMSGIGIKSE